MLGYRQALKALCFWHVTIRAYSAVGYVVPTFPEISDEAKKKELQKVHSFANDELISKEIFEIKIKKEILGYGAQGAVLEATKTSVSDTGDKGKPVEIVVKLKKFIDVKKEELEGTFLEKRFENLRILLNDEEGTDNLPAYYGYGYLIHEDKIKPGNDNITVTIAIYMEKLPLKFEQVIKGPDDIRKFLRQAHDAIDHIHKKGIVLGDIKPDNIMFRKDATVTPSNVIGEDPTQIVFIDVDTPWKINFECYPFKRMNPCKDFGTETYRLEGAEMIKEIHDYYSIIMTAAEVKLGSYKKLKEKSLAPSWPEVIKKHLSCKNEPSDDKHCVVRNMCEKLLEKEFSSYCTAVTNTKNDIDVDDIKEAIDKRSSKLKYFPFGNYKRAPVLPQDSYDAFGGMPVDQTND